MKQGKIHVYTGNGKGKTTAALGLAIRSIGQGFNVAMIQFMKGGAYTGEFLAAKQLPRFHIKQFGRPCIKQQRSLLDWGVEKIHEIARQNIDCGECRFCFLNYNVQKDYVEQGFLHALEIIKSGKHDLVILDEINVAANLKFLDPKLLLKLIEEKKPHTEIIFTGRGAPEELIQKADLVTVMQPIKHYFDKGVNARRGIEY